MAIKSMIRLNQLEHEIADYDVAAENSALTALSSRSDLDEGLKRLTEILVQRHGFGAHTSSFLTEDHQGKLAHFGAAVTADLVIKHEGAADIEIDSAQAVSIDGETASNFTVTGSGESLSLIAAGGGAQKVLVQSAGTGSDAVHLNASSGGVDVDASAGVVIVGGTASSFNATTGDLTLAADAASVNITAAEVASDAIKLEASAGGYSLSAATGLSETVTAGGASREVQAGDIDIKCSDTDAAQSLNLHVRADADVDALRLEMDSTFDGSANSEDNSVISLINAVGTGDSAIKLQAESGSMDFDANTNVTMDAGSAITMVASAGNLSATSTSAGIVLSAGVNVDIDATEDVLIDAADMLKMRGAVGDTEYTPGAMASGVDAASQLGSDKSATVISGMNSAGDFAAINEGNLLIFGSANTSANDIDANGFALTDLGGAGTYGSSDFSSIDNVQGLFLGDAHCVASDWSIDAIPLAVATSEWNDFRNAFGEVSLLNALAQAGAGATDAGLYQVEIDVAGVAEAAALMSGADYANTVFAAAATARQFDAATAGAVTEIDIAANTSYEELMERLCVYVNGQRLMQSYDDGAGSLESQDFDMSLIESDDAIVTALTAANRQSLAAKLRIDFKFALEQYDVIIIEIQ